jgi:2-polyprenyl-6-methoxyphenol hydroxylase-like FAD-dependent oxidoreductase
MEQISTTCVIAGGGPAGMMLGYLLARAGVDVTVLEKHKDFLRDFRGDTVHPSTLEVMHELGLLERFLKLPHTKIRSGTVEIGDARFTVGDFSRLPTHCKFIALMPQWDFLDFLAAEAKRFANFHLLMETEAKDLLARHGRISGILATGPNGHVQIRAGLTIAADGRRSVLRAKSGLKVKHLSAPIDVLWLRLPMEEGDPQDLVARLKGGQFFAMFPRNGYWQCGYLIEKDSFPGIKVIGLARFRDSLKEVAGFAASRVDEAIQDFSEVKLLTVMVNRMTSWVRPGLLCIGDAAHGMSPVGGVGINLAIQDAVATANILGPVLQKGIAKLSDLRKVQRRREFPTWIIQTFQVLVQNFVLRRALNGAPLKPPRLLKWLNRWPWARQFPGRFIGLGVRPEHVRLAPKRMDPLPSALAAPHGG